MSPSDASTPPNLVLTDAPSEADTTVIEAGLSEFNAEQAGFSDARPLAILIKEGHGDETVGGLLGRTSLGLLFVDLLYIPEHLRGYGLGARTLAQAEAEARRRGCRSGVVYTISFQAPDFYKRYDWVEFGRVPCEPPGTSRVFLSKTLS